MKMNNLTVQSVKLYYRRGAKVTERKYFLLSAETAESKNGSFSSLVFLRRHGFLFCRPSRKENIPSALFATRR
jgi:hypothetical protein